LNATDELRANRATLCTKENISPWVQSARGRAAREHGWLDIVFNNADLLGALGQIDAISADDWDKILAILLRAVFMGINHAVSRCGKLAAGR
jgi:NAD(P)-dependent dehydrogenase (short-subunit alcohol dehydrogenase family)